MFFSPPSPKPRVSPKKGGWAEHGAGSGQNLRKVGIKAEREERDSDEQGRRKEGQRGMCTSVPFPFLNPVWVYLAAKPIHHAEDRCLRLKVTVNGKTSECQGPVNLLPPSLILGLAYRPGMVGRSTACPTQHPHSYLPRTVPDLWPPLCFSSQSSGP